jgi:hypothetical protein
MDNPDVPDTTLQIEHLSLLARLVGQTWHSISGNDLASHSSSDSLVIETDDLCVELRGDILESSFTGALDTYSFLQVAEVARNAASMNKAKGDFFAKCAGEKLLEITLIEETVVCRTGGQIEWTYRSDAGLLFSFEDSQILVRKLGLTDEDLGVEFMGTFHLDEFYLPDSWWGEDPERSHDFSLTALSIDAAIARRQQSA